MDNAPVDQPLTGARRARLWLAVWLVCATICLVATFVTLLWATSGGSGTPAVQPCNATDPGGVLAWIIAILGSVAVAAVAIPLFRWACPALVRSERRAWAILMGTVGAFLILGFCSLPMWFVAGGTGCGL
jgi:hypothetical protein